MHAAIWRASSIPTYSMYIKGGMVVPPQKMENFVFFKWNRAICWVLLDANLIKAKKQNPSFTGSTDPNCALWENFTGGGGAQMIAHLHRSSTISQTLGGNYAYDSTHFGSQNKCQVYLKLCNRKRLKCKAQCRAHWSARENFEI